MTNIEMIEKLSSKAGVTKEEAEEALRKSNWDILDAMLYLERNKGDKYVTAARGYSSYNNKEQNTNKEEAKEDGDSTVGCYLNKILNWGFDNELIISKGSNKIITIPIILFIILLIFSFSSILVLMIIGMFFDFKYSFNGPQLGDKGLNSVMDKIYDLVENIKHSVKK